MCDDFPDREVVTTRDSSQLSPSVTMQGQYSTPGPVTSAPHAGERREGAWEPGRGIQGKYQQKHNRQQPLHDARTDTSDFLAFSSENLVLCNCPSNLFTFYKT